MNFNPKYKKIVSIVLIIVAVCLLLTGIILNKMIRETNNRIEQNWFFAESVRTGQPVVLLDAFILSNEEGVLKFIYDYQTYEVEGKLEEAYFTMKLSVKSSSTRSLLRRFPYMSFM